MRTLLTTLAFILLLLVSLAWWRGRTHADGLAIVTPAGKFHVIGIHRGRVLVVMTDVIVRRGGARGGTFLSSPTDAVDHMVETIHRNDMVRVNALGVRVTSGDAPINELAPGGGRTLVILPPWVPCLVAAAIIVAPAMKRRRHVPGHCRACGYDLRGSGERCPECGTAMEVDNASPDCARV
jgi:hypothetical protein